MFKLRRRAAAASAPSGMPFCTMCGTAMRIDPAAGRCALGHRVSVPAGAVFEPEVAEAPEPYTPAEPVYAGDTAELYAPIDEEVYDRYQTEDTIVWEPAPTPPPLVWDDEPATEEAKGLGTWDSQPAPEETERLLTWDAAPAADEGDSLLTWDEPHSPSALDVAPDELPAAGEPGPAAGGVTTPLAADLLDELADVAHARRQAAGTIGATIAVGVLIMGSVALLPF